MNIVLIGMSGAGKSTLGVACQSSGDVPYDEIQRRLTNITTRGIVIQKGSSLQDVYDERVPLYLKYSDLTLDCSNKGIEACTADIINNIRRRQLQ
ncbi:shikimate kinase [Paenibacillus mucilaginosus]